MSYIFGIENMDKSKFNLPQPKKALEQTFCEKYKKDFPFITNSKVSDKHAYCKDCKRDFKISHGGRSDIVQHLKTKLHQNSVSSQSSGQRSITSYGCRALRICLFKSWQLCFSEIVYNNIS